MKIAFVISTFLPKTGGMGQMVYAQALGLISRGHDVTVFSLDYGLRLPKSDLKVVYIRPWIRLGDAGLVPQLFFRLRGFDLAHFNFPFYGGGLITYLACFFSGTPFVVSYHMDAKPRGILKNIFKFFADKLTCNIIFKKASKVIAVDDNADQFELINKIPKDNLVKIYNAVDTDVFSPKNVSSIPVGLSGIEQKQILLFVGNLMPVKRLDLILEALSRLNKNTVLVVVGGGGYDESRYHALAEELSVADRVYFVGKVSDPKILAEYYAVSDATVIASDYESFSLVAVESMACGTPVIATDLPALRKKVSDDINGLLFEKGNSDDLVKKIEYFFNLSAGSRQAMGENARKKVLEKYSLKDNIENLIKVYRTLV